MGLFSFTLAAQAEDRTGFAVHHDNEWATAYLTVRGQLMGAIGCVDLHAKPLSTVRASDLLVILHFHDLGPWNRTLLLVPVFQNRFIKLPAPGNLHH